jgi:hypothetical protein
VEQSILNSTKQILGLPLDYTPFDQQVIPLVNSALGTLAQLGVGPVGGTMIEDAEANWDLLALPSDQLSMAKVYVFLKVKFLFDPPPTGFLVQAMKEQIAEHEWRLKQMAESLNALPVPQVVRPKPVSDAVDVVYVPLPNYIDGGY